jgi:hypothetical protein
MSSGNTRELVAWLDSLDDDELVAYRFELYDRCELAGEDSDTYGFARGALDVVHAVEARRDIRRGLRMMCQVAAPYADADEFADAVIALARAQRQLGSDTDAGEVFSAALEVAQRRAEGNELDEKRREDAES